MFKRPTTFINLFKSIFSINIRNYLTYFRKIKNENTEYKNEGQNKKNSTFFKPIILSGSLTNLVSVSLNFTVPNSTVFSLFKKLHLFHFAYVITFTWLKILKVTKGTYLVIY